jgi:hypothetical protein
MKRLEMKHGTVQEHFHKFVFSHLILPAAPHVKAAVLSISSPCSTALCFQHGLNSWRNLEKDRTGLRTLAVNQVSYGIYGICPNYRSSNVMVTFLTNECHPSYWSHLIRNWTVWAVDSCPVHRSFFVLLVVSSPLCITAE